MAWRTRTHSQSLMINPGAITHSHTHSKQTGNARTYAHTRTQTHSRLVNGVSGAKSGGRVEGCGHDGGNSGGGGDVVDGGDDAGTVMEEEEEAAFVAALRAGLDESPVCYSML